MPAGFIVAIEEQASTETIPWGIDFASLILPGDSLTSPASQLTDLITQTSYPAGLSGQPVVQGTQVIQAVTALQQGKRYMLILSATLSTNKRVSRAIELKTRY